MKYAWIVFLFAAQLAFGQQSPHGKITIACENCHSSDSWKMRQDAKFNHSTTGFELIGKHQNIPCASCHEKLVFTKRNSDCTSCHTDIHRQELGDNCQRCHTMQSWVITDMQQKHQQTRFALLGKHLLATCDQCHERASAHRFAGTPIECVACHRTDYQSTANPNHEASGFPMDCARCHTTNATSFKTGFNHDLTAFPLTGKHRSAICSDCHKNNQLTKISSQCYGCHSGDFAGTEEPNHQAGMFSHDCKSCHTTTSWEPSTFDHSTTAFPLTGEHRNVQCQSCHKNGNYQLTYTNCNQCHQQDYQSATNPNHVSGNFSHDCQSCHTTAHWNPATFDHSQTQFALTGKHLTVQCQSCHTSGNYQLTYNNCYQCHQTDYQAVTNPNHQSGGFSHNCTSCHTTSGWQPSTFSHSSTQFPLTGQHLVIQCQSCHTNGNYQLAYANCYQCHQSNFETTTNPNHLTGNFSHDCQSCHTTTAWQPATFDHASTQFPLTGQHLVIQCQSCHTNGNYQLTYTNCYQCHQPNFEATTNPNHLTGNFSHDCTTCHTTSAWQPAFFDHSATQFPLTGRHLTIQCQSCHISGNYQLTFSDCYQCHQTDYQEATNPDHQSGGFSHNCATCHNTSSWDPSTFSHSTTQFALTGQHLIIQCQSCHTNGNYQLTYTNCYQCHQPNFEATTNPNHLTGNFSHDCTSCHNSSAWQPSTFNHSSTQFPLTGQHLTIQCQSCHTNGNYQLTYTNCYQCHQPNFEATTNPNHLSGNFSHDCQTCHTTTAWQPASYDHTATNFPLTGSHLAIQCQSCHVNNNYQLTYTECYQCHATDYQTPTTPNHVALNFGHDCQSCHTTIAWLPATFNHDQLYFKIYSGAHQGKWTLCSDCHQNISDHSQFSCLTCHEHNQVDMDIKHAQVTNYVYSSPACYSCHRNR